MYDFSFYKNKKVLITGHTGFKGTWMCELLLRAGAEVIGYALEPPTTPSLFELCGVSERMHSVIGDVRDLAHLQEVFKETQPEIVIHMAAQPIVRTSYKEPVYTYEVNVMGTVNVLECIRGCDSVRSFVNVTTDKVYLNREWDRGYVESDELNGYDPYSNSKSCSELVTSAYMNSFLRDRGVAVSTVRAGNVIGGGDFAVDRIIPDCVRAAEKGEPIVVRNPYSVRPFQHVLEPVTAYLMIAMEQYRDGSKSGCYNVGPDDEDCLTTGKLVELFCEKWNGWQARRTGEPRKPLSGAEEDGSATELTWISQPDGGPHEAGYLKLNCAKLKETFDWHPVWHMDTVIEKIVEWETLRIGGGDILGCMDRQIEEFCGARKQKFMSGKRQTCIACGRKFDQSIYAMDHVPALVQHMAKTEGEAEGQKVDLLLYQCRFCGLVQFDCEPVYYYRDVVRAGGLSAHLKELRRQQYQHFIHTYDLTGKKIIEIGCGGGEFLEVLREYEVEGCGIENDEALVKRARESGLDVLSAYSDAQWRDERGPFDAFLSFNYLEHQPDPNAFLQGIYQNLSEGAVGLVTVPSFEFFMEKGAYYEFMRDHIAYYTEKSLALLFENNGFEVLEAERFNGDTNQMIVRKRRPHSLPDFDGQRRRIEEKINGYMKRHGVEKIAVWGASHQGLTMLATLELCKPIRYIVDSAPFKWDCYSPVSHLAIRPPEYFYQDEIELVIIMAPAFSKEISANIKKNGKVGHILAVRDADVFDMTER